MPMNAMLPPQAPPVKVDPVSGKLVPADTPPPSAAALGMGFQGFASVPENNQKIQQAMTPPDAPLQPNSGQQAPQQMASSMPPPAAPMASSMPPGGFGSARAAAQPIGAEPSGNISLPAAPAPVMASSAPPVQSQAGADQAELQRLQQGGAGLNKIGNPWLRGLARAGDIAAPFLLGSGAMAIPGTSAHNLWLQNMQQGRVTNDQAAQAADLAQQTGLAGLAKTQAETAAIPINAGMKRQTYLAALAGKGLREDENGAIVPDENSPVYQQQQMQQDLIKAHADNFKAGTELKAAQAEFEKTKGDPNSPAYKLAQQRLSVAQQNANAAGQRAQAYMGRYLQSAYNIDAQGNVLPGATQISDEAGNITTVGTGNAALAAKAQPNAAMFNEVGNATDALEQKAENLVKSGGKLNDVRVAAAIKDPETTSGQWAQGEFANSGLTPEQRDYVIAVKAYKERLQPLRKSAGGGVSDAQVERLLAMAPGAATPDLDYLKRQTKEIRALQNNLAAGVTTAKGGLSVKGRGNPMAPPASGGPNVGDTKTFPNGKKGRWDGTGWEAQ